MNILISGGHVIDPANQVDAPAAISIAEGRIVAVGKPAAGFVADAEIKANGCVVCPGLVDLAARLREPGFEYRATLASEMAAAAAGGVTSLACPPDTDPPLDEPGLVEMLKRRARAPNFAHVYPVGALTVGLAGRQLTEMTQLADAGCVAFSQANTAVTDTQVLLRALQYAATFDYPVWLSARDPWLSAGGFAHDGAVAARLGLAGIPVLAETVALSAILQLAQATGARVHITRLSSRAGLELIRSARGQGARVSCDVAVHHLHLCDEDIGFFDPLARFDPPLRSSADREALAKGLADGEIDALCSNHTPVDDDGKQLPFAEAECGATALELLLPLTLKWARDTGLCCLPDALAKITVQPARILGIDAGTLSLGSRADLCIFDPRATFEVTRERLKSQGKNTPFLGQWLPGVVRYTLINGSLAYSLDGLAG